MSEPAIHLAIDPQIELALQRIPAGAWALAVSGGADSIALLHLLRQQSHRDLDLTVAHLNHQTRGDESDADADFVRERCRSMNLPCQIVLRSDIEPRVNDLPANLSAKYRRLRFAMFNELIRAKKLRGVILAHHADDQAETVFLRLLRGGGHSSLAGMSFRANVNGVPVLRPLLTIRRAMLRNFLTENHLTWREDSSNRSPRYLRNRVRAVLTEPLTTDLLTLTDACAELKQWVETAAPKLAREFPARQLADLPTILARRSAADWLGARGVPRDQLDRRVSDRLIEMCTDAATAPRRQFPGNITVRRSRGIIRIME